MPTWTKVVLLCALCLGTVGGLITALVLWLA